MPRTSTLRQPRLNSSQVLILQALARRDGQTSTQLSERGLAASSSNLGPVYLETLQDREDAYSLSLYGLGYVRPQQMEGEPVTWHLTATGRTAAARYKARTRGASVKVPPAVLDPLMRKFRITRTYSFEDYTDADVKEIRDKLGREYATLPLTDLRQQITTRRKMGAFTDPATRKRRDVERVLRLVGPEGSLLPLLTASQVAKLHELT